MNRFTKAIAAFGFAVVSSTVFAAPAQLVIHNNTAVESNAFVAGMPSPKPSKPYSTNIVPWPMVQIACLNHKTNGICPAVIKMATNTANPITVGTVNLNINTGEITPSMITANGYTMVVNGIAEGTITETK